MENKSYCIALLLIVNLFSSCSSDDLQFQNEFETSQNIWLNFKGSTNNSYKYTVVNGSWVGYSSETIITVDNGIIIQRDYLYTGFNEDIPASDLEWTETENEIGTHDRGAEPLTLDEIYSKAQHEWLIDRENATIRFEVENNGMISKCGYILNNDIDPSFIGINIKSIENL